MMNIKNRKIIFIDIDGVLNSHMFDLNNQKTQFTNNPEIDPSTILLLNEILEFDKSIFLIISSSWADTKTLTELRNLLEKNGLQTNRVCGKINYKVGKRESIHQILEKYRIEKFCVIDDEWIFNLNDKCQKNFIKISFYEGLKQKHIEIVKNLFEI